MNKKINSRGSVSYFFVFVILSVVLVTLFAFAIPLLQAIDTAFYEAGEDILLDANETASNIQNDNIRESIQANFQAQTESIPTQIDILSTFHQYGWIIIILAIVLVIFLITRQTVELEVR